MTLRGCLLPDGLFYDPPNHAWYAPGAEGVVRVGLTAVAVALASNRIFAVTPKRPGRVFEAGRSAATIESSKWVGPMRLAFDGVVVATNTALETRPELAATDPYGLGWVLEARPTGEFGLSLLAAGDAAREAYAAWMDENDFPGCAGAQ